MELHPDHVNREDSLTYNGSWKPFLRVLREREIVDGLFSSSD